MHPPLPAIARAAAVLLVAVAAALVTVPTALATETHGEQLRLSMTGAEGDATRTGQRPSVAWNSRREEYLAVWNADGFLVDNDGEIVGRRLDPEGRELGGEMRLTVTGPENDATRQALAPDVAYNAIDDEYLIVFEAVGVVAPGKREIFGRLLDGGGSPLSPAFRVSTTGIDTDTSRSAARPVAVHDPATNQYLVAWHGQGVGSSQRREIFAQRLAADRAALGGDIRISTTLPDGTSTRNAMQPDVAWNPVTGEYLLVWYADGLATDNELEIFGTRLGPDGLERGADFRISFAGADGDATRGAHSVHVAISPLTGVGLVTWSDDRLTDGRDDVWSRRIGPAGGLVGEDVMIREGGSNVDVAHGAAADEWLASYVGLTPSGDAELYARRIGAGGAALDEDVRLSVTGADGDKARYPEPNSGRLAYSPRSNEYLALWSADAVAADNKFEVFARRVGGGSAPPAPADNPTVTATETATVDRTPPFVKARTPARKRVRARGIAAWVSCTEACRVTLTAKLRAGARSVTLAPAARDVAAAAEERLFLRFSRRARRTARRALANGRTATVRMRFVATDAAGNEISTMRSVVLRR